MKSVQQTILAPPNGNCLAACVASLLELELSEVPNFGELDKWELDNSTGEWNSSTLEGENPQWWKTLCQFLQSRGLRLFQLAYPREGETCMWAGNCQEGDLAIATIDSPRGNWLHSLIVDLKLGEVVWDPHPEGFKKGRPITVDEVQDFIVVFPGSLGVYGVSGR